MPAPWSHLVVGLGLACASTLFSPATAVCQDAEWGGIAVVGVVRLDEKGDPATLGSDRVETDADATYGIGVERVLDDHWSVELVASTVDAGLEIVSDDPRLRPPDDREEVDLDVVAIDARVVRRWPLAGRLVLRTEAGAGAIRAATEERDFAPPCFFEGPGSCDVVYTIQDESETFLVLRLGGGIEVPLDGRWTARITVSDRMQVCAVSTMEKGRDRSLIGRLVCGSEGQGPLLHHLGATLGLGIRI